MAGLDFKSLTEATSGAVGGLISTALLYPLDTLKTKYQVEAVDPRSRKYNSLWDVLKEAVEARQLGSLYQGLATKALHSIIAQFIYFYSYSFFKHAYLARSGKKSLGTAVNLVVAAGAGAVTSVLTQPLDTAAAKIQSSNFGATRSLRDALASDCVGAFDGLGASLFLTSNPAIQYTAFEQLKSRILHRHLSKSVVESAVAEIGPGPSLSMAAAFFLGAFSKTVATILTYPAIRCKVLIQAGQNPPSIQHGSVGHPRPPKSMVHAMWIIWKTEGALGFYKGLNAQILKTVLSAAVMLAIKEKTAEATVLAMLLAQRWIQSTYQMMSSSLSGGRTRGVTGAILKQS